MMADDLNPLAAGPSASAQPALIGRVDTVSHFSTVVRLDSEALAKLQDHEDQAMALSGSLSGQVKIRVGSTMLIGNVRSMLATSETPAGSRPYVRAEIELLGEGRTGPGGEMHSFRRGITRYPAPGDDVLPVTLADMTNLFEVRDTHGIEVGGIYPTTTVRAVLNTEALLSRHFALLGSTGSGKSNAAALIMHRIIESAPFAHIVVIDPHGEYPQSFDGKSMVFNVDNLALPYWLMNFEEHGEVFITSEGVERELDRAILARCLGKARAKSVLASPGDDVSVDSPLPYLMADLMGALDSEMGRLDNVSEISRYVRLKNRMDEVLRDNRYSFMFDRSLTTDTMKRFLSRVLRMESDGKPLAIIDLSGVPTDIVSVVVALVARIVMDHAIWSRNDAHRPILLVCEEAHRYVPIERVTSGAAVRRSLERIAKEGRKYGVSLGLISQRPSDLAEGALSQCGTIITMRMNNERDQLCVRNAMPEGGRSLLDSLPGLRKGECIISGEGVSLPVRAMLDLLPESKQPHSKEPSFMNIWNDRSEGETGLDRTIKRWRNLKTADDAALGRPSKTEDRISLLRSPSSKLMD